MTPSGSSQGAAVIVALKPRADAFLGALEPARLLQTSQHWQGKPRPGDLSVEVLRKRFPREFCV